MNGISNMDSNTDNFFKSIETENKKLIEEVTNLESEIFRISQENTDLKKALEKQKKFHRKYAEDVVATEKIRIQDFNEEKSSLNEQNKNLCKENRQLKIDLSFYKQAYEELAKEQEIGSSSESSRRNSTLLSASPSPRPMRMAKVLKSTATTTSASETPACECTHKSSKVLSKVNKKMFDDNKKLMSKISTLTTTIAMLKNKNKQLENFRKKIENKKGKFLQDSEELERLVASTRKKNKETFNEEALARLREFIK